VKDPSGQTWRVHRRWLPWNPRAHKQKFEPGDVFGAVFDGVDEPAGLLIAIPVGILLALLAPILGLVLLTGVEFILLAVVLPFAVVGRMFFGKRWWIQVRRGRSLEREEMVGTWAESGHRVRTTAKAISVQAPAEAAPSEASELSR